MSIIENSRKLVLPVIHPGESDMSWDDMVRQLEEEWDQLPAESRPVALLIDTTGVGLGVLERLRDTRSTLPYVGLIFDGFTPESRHPTIRLPARCCGVRACRPEDIAYAPRRCDAVATHSP